MKRKPLSCVCCALWQWSERYGILQAVYTDKKNVFVTKREPSIEEQLAGIEPRPAFGKSCGQLYVEIMTADSSQAKGRVERAHGVLQDRFVKELQLKGITTIEAANELLQNGFIESLNRKLPIAGIWQRIHETTGYLLRNAAGETTLTRQPRPVVPIACP